ncbi:MAG: hypothetical protein IJU59_01055 [Firmicutes bacterium]|jgi:hypothetical protein|nr:hypothetical protein [Bacillota bacterium]
MAEKTPKEKKITNRTRDMIADYVITNQHITKEYDRQHDEEKARRKATGEKRKMTYTEKLYTAVIVIGLILIIVRYGILKI